VEGRAVDAFPDYVRANWERVRHQLESRSWGISMAERLRRLSRYIRGWLGHYGVPEYKKPIAELDGWIRRRVRMCYWKQWKNRRTRIGKLMNRLVRTRMPGGVGTGGETPPAYPIRLEFGENANGQDILRAYRRG